MFTNSSIVSLVVPSTSVTIALSSLRIAFKSEDFPAFGLPYEKELEYEVYDPDTYKQLNLSICKGKISIFSNISTFVTFGVSYSG